TTTVYYDQGLKTRAKNVLTFLQSESEAIQKKLQIKNRQPLNAYMYQKQSSLQIRKYGLVTLLFAPIWYVGDSRFSDVYFIDPASRVNGMSQDEIYKVMKHELVHHFTNEMNPKLPYFLDNGLATYLANQTPNPLFHKHYPVFTYADTHLENELAFGTKGGYAYSYTYIEFLTNVYGWEKLCALIKNQNDYVSIYKKSEKQIYEEWMKYLDAHYE
ncbi:MAG: hypothetical protein ACRC5C_07800, partial [Bacilli bacterium]